MEPFSSVSRGKTEEAGTGNPDYRNLGAAPKRRSLLLGLFGKNRPLPSDSLTTYRCLQITGHPSPGLRLPLYQPEPSGTGVVLVAAVGAAPAARPDSGM